MSLQNIKQSWMITLKQVISPFFKLTNDRYLQRLADIEKMSQDIFAKPINLDEDEDIIMEPKLKKNPTNQKEMYAEWKKFIKYNILQEMQTLNEKEES